MVILLLTIGSWAALEWRFIGLQSLKKCLFFCSVFPLLEPLLKINHLRHNQHYAHTNFTRRITRHYALVELSALPPPLCIGR